MIDGVEYVLDDRERVGRQRLVPEWWIEPERLSVEEEVAREWGEATWTARILYRGEVAGRRIVASLGRGWIVLDREGAAEIRERLGLPFDYLTPIG